MRVSRILILLVVFLALGACASSPVMMDYNIAGLWSGYRTYNLLPQPRPEDIGSLAVNPSNRTSIEDAVNWAMKNRGMLLDETNPDLLVAYYAGHETAIDPKVWGYAYSPKGSYKDEQGPPSTYKGNTIVIDLVDAKSKELMWRGWSAGVVSAPNNDKTENSIRDVVKKIMAEIRLDSLGGEMENMKRHFPIGITLVAVVLLSGCSSWNNKEKGAVIGAASGAVIGGVIGNAAGNTAVGAIIGAAVGGTAGVIIGNYMDKQAAEIERDLEGAKVERIGEGIKITFHSGLLFDVNKSDIKPDAQINLVKLATILNKYPDTEVLIEGHTDSTGTHDHNMDLSMRRAQTVANALNAQQVLASRLNQMGYGPDQPVASNTSPVGRTANRRVEIAIFANDKLKGTAEKQAEQQGG